MAKKVTNINDGGKVGIQSGNDEARTGSDQDTTEVTNVNTGGTVGIQGVNVSGCTVIQG
jgi:hypothetical protein